MRCLDRPLALDRNSVHDPALAPVVVYRVVLDTANATEHREPYEWRGSRTVLGAPGGETPPGDSTTAVVRADVLATLRLPVSA